MMSPFSGSTDPNIKVGRGTTHVHLPFKNKYLTKFFTYGCAIHGDLYSLRFLYMSNSLKYRSPRKSKHLLYNGTFHNFEVEVVFTRK